MYRRLDIDLSTVDRYGIDQIVRIKVTRCMAHPKLPHHFYHLYETTIDGVKYLGNILHNFNNGPVSLAAKVTKAIVAELKAQREARP